MKHEPLASMDATLLERRASERRVETLAEETPIALVYNGRPHAVMMATAADLDDFAIGFTLSEGIADSVESIEIVDRLHTDRGISLQMLIPQKAFDTLGARERSLSGRIGCGLCGTSSLEAAIRPVRIVSAATPVGLSELLACSERLGASQPLNEASGAVHAAALLLDDGEIVVREDIGRHNAIDKAIGAAAIRRCRSRALVVTSRASYEVVHKAAQANCAVVAAISAPTALAVRLAKEAGITLIGFARQDRMTVYSGQSPI